MSAIIKEREKAMQLAMVSGSNTPKQERYLRQVDSLDGSIAICHETLNYMLARNLRTVSRGGK